MAMTRRTDRLRADDQHISISDHSSPQAPAPVVARIALYPRFIIPVVPRERSSAETFDGSVVTVDGAAPSAANDVYATLQLEWSRPERDFPNQKPVSGSAEIAAAMRTPIRSF
uniref:Neur_chan_LBD domain-containing protein n=1 Tax=Steinernema glaseri TaxID=37863 RepID=A0A1I7Y6D1_9BILA